MWLLSFAWRNRNLKQKQKGKREGRVKKKQEAERGGKMPSHTTEHHLPSVQSSLTRTDTIYAWQTLPLQQANRLLKCTCKKTETTLFQL